MEHAVGQRSYTAASNVISLQTVCISERGFAVLTSERICQKVNYNSVILFFSITVLPLLLNMMTN